ncbi:Stk1 family PASTA domain-containing Ser/Thr kinase [Natronospora cellulosivora (SeqCode)]
MIGKVLNERYEILKELGKGGMAIVFEAQDLLLDRKVALKMLRHEYLNDKDFVKRFRHEAKAVARLAHPNIINIFDIGQKGEYQYLVMEYIEGRTLKDIIRKEGKIDFTEALDIAKQICSALLVAHENNIIHCDIKPHNILLTKDKQVKVTDFGIARAISSATMTMTDTVMGSAHYFSPEQARGGEIKAHSDLYSLGIVLYEMLTGEVPFKGDSPISVALKHIQEQAKKPSLLNPEIPEQLEKLVMRAIAKRPSERFRDAQDMKNKIEKIQNNIINYKFADIAEGDTRVIKKSDLKKEYYTNNNNREDRENERQYLTYREEKKQIPLWIKLIFSVIILGLIISAGVFIFYRAIMDVPVVRVPDIVGMDIDQASDETAIVGLQLDIQEERVYHPDIPEGHIISQFPTAGERVRQTRRIQVTISQGPAILTAPDLRFSTQREATVILNNMQLELGEVKEEYSNSVALGRIISQDPEAGEEISPETEINIVLSIGPHPNMVKMPNILGLDREEAFDILENNNLEPGEIIEEETQRFLDNQIAEQAYPPGDEIPEGSSVDLTISSGLINRERSDVHSNVLMRYNVPPGPLSQRVDIVIIDDNGRDTIYSETHRPGDLIAVRFNSVGTTDYEIYINGDLKHDDRLFRR